MRLSGAAEGGSSGEELALPRRAARAGGQPSLSFQRAI